MWQSTEKEAGTQVFMEKIEQWEVLEIQTKVYGKSTYRMDITKIVKYELRYNVIYIYDRAVPKWNHMSNANWKLCQRLSPNVNRTPSQVF